VPKKRVRRSPRWARWCLSFGALLLVVGGGSLVVLEVTVSAATRSVTQENLLGAARSTQTETHASVTGAKNILLVGIDARKNQAAGTAVRSDSIIILHISADHRQAYLISLPRDSYVAIPAYNNGAQTYAGGKNKINAAFAYGSAA